MELMFEEDIRNVVNTSIMLHNMMVELRLRRNEEEDIGWYDEREEEDEQFDVPLLLSNVPPVAPPVPTVRQRIAALNLQWPDETHEWAELYNRKKHYELRDAIIEQLLLNKDD
jgi:hypothetical protein